MELIYRQDAIDALEEPCKVPDTWTDEYAVGQRMQWEKDVKALNSLPSAEPEPQWIPCSERLPEEMGTYMTTIDYGKYGRMAGQRHYHGAFGWGDDRVVAWMPLPEPWKGDVDA